MRIAIIGGGASGIMAALVAAKLGATVFMIERNDRIGKKILNTGNGRCNFTNMYISMDNYHSENEGFYEYALTEFDKEKTLKFFRNLGIEHTVEGDGKIFPVTLQAASFLNSLRMALEYSDVTVLEDHFVQKIKKTKDGFSLKIKDKDSFFAQKVIVAAGGMSMPKSGSDGKGYSLLQELGHRLVPTSPGLVQFNLDSPYLKQISGVKIVGELKLMVGQEVIDKSTGDILFTNYGISGPTVFDLTRKAQKLLASNKKAELSIPLINNIDSVEDTRHNLIERFREFDYMTVEQSLIGIVNKKLIFLITRKLDINPNTIISHIDSLKISELVDLLLDYRVPVTSTQGYGNSQVTLGGIDTTQFDSSTMESKLVPGLYAVGEVLDVDGDCGGYNLQWAWSSAYIAAASACKSQ